MRQYIINYEGEEDDDTDDDVAHFFKELLIDAPQDLSLDTDTTNELFLTQLGPLQNIESTITTNLLADNAFKHQITSADTTVPLVNNLHTSIVNYEAIYKPMEERYLDENEDDEVYLTDCQYRRGRFKPRGLRYHRRKRLKEMKMVKQKT